MLLLEQRVEIKIWDFTRTVTSRIVVTCAVVAMIIVTAFYASTTLTPSGIFRREEVGDVNATLLCIAWKIEFLWNFCRIDFQIAEDKKWLALIMIDSVTMKIDFVFRFEF